MKLSTKSNKSGTANQPQPLSLICFAIVLLITAFGGLLAFPAAAQSDRGSLSGNVMDSSGAVIPKANITATNLQTGSVTSTLSTSAGSYTLASLPAGLYSLEVMAPGFLSYLPAKRHHHFCRQPHPAGCEARGRPGHRRHHRHRRRHPAQD